MPARSTERHPLFRPLQRRPCRWLMHPPSDTLSSDPSQSCDGHRSNRGQCRGYGAEIRPGFWTPANQTAATLFVVNAGKAIGAVRRGCFVR